MLYDTTFKEECYMTLLLKRNVIILQMKCILRVTYVITVVYRHYILNRLLNAASVTLVRYGQ